MKTLTTTWWANFYYIYFDHPHNVHTHKTLKKDEQFKIFKFNWHTVIYLLNSYYTLYCFLPTWGQTTGHENLENLPSHSQQLFPYLLPGISIQLPCYQEEYAEDTSMNHSNWFHIIYMLSAHYLFIITRCRPRNHKNLISMVLFRPINGQNKPLQPSHKNVHFISFKTNWLTKQLAFIFTVSPWTLSPQTEPFHIHP